ncbi:MAG TPA: hypothetical protein VK673_10145 [Chthoniobacterales bacterium]|nr:hypothetical protein [Chthoniobacterales bacterium]
MADSKALAAFAVRIRAPDLMATLEMLFLHAGLQAIPSARHSISTGLNLPEAQSLPKL